MIHGKNCKYVLPFSYITTTNLSNFDKYHKEVTHMWKQQCDECRRCLDPPLDKSKPKKVMGFYTSGKGEQKKSY